MENPNTPANNPGMEIIAAVETQVSHAPLPRILPLKEVLVLTSMSRSTIYNLMNNVLFPFPAAVRIGPRRVGWLESDVRKWLADRQRYGMSAFLAA